VKPNGTLIDDMTYAGIGLADAFWALSEDDNKNTMAAQIAIHIFNIPNVLCLINDHEKVEAFQKLDLQIISATNTVAENILTLIGSTA
jgi:Trk K+ transport system NAD-binding subunit